MVDLAAWAEIDLNALAHNVKEVCRVKGSKAEVMAVVKANAYGHGAVEVAKTALDNGATRLAVARTTEGIQLREAGIKVPILVLGYTPLEQIPEIIEYGLEQTVYGLDYALKVSQKAVQLGVNLPVHIKIDTGMGRIGVIANEDSAIMEIKEIASLPYLLPIGIFTHFAAADSADKAYTNSQLEGFNKLLEGLRREGLEFPLCHAANSAALIDYPGSHLNMVRAGIILYGLYPSDEVSKQKISLKPVMSFKSRVAFIKKVQAGFSVSYGCTHKTASPATIATIPVGYADGYSRLISNRGEVLVKGCRAPVIGRVCMDQFMIDVSEIPDVTPGDEVVLFGKQGGETLPVEDIARWIGTINYEVVCMVSARVPRIYINSSSICC